MGNIVNSKSKSSKSINSKSINNKYLNKNYLSLDETQKIQSFLDKYSNYIDYSTKKLLEYNKKNIKKGNFIKRSVNKATTITGNQIKNNHKKSIYDSIFYNTIKKTNILS
jgi:hypothetical protein